jgi:microcystin-dependent protein
LSSLTFLIIKKTMDIFIGEIRPFSFSFAPANWMLCDGQSLPIMQYAGLYSIIGTKYGGNATSFNLPDIQSTVLVGSGTLPGGGTYIHGQKGGDTGVVLAGSQMPAHTHVFNGLVANDSSGPEKGVNMPSDTSYISNVFEVPPRTMKRQGHFFSASSPTSVLNSSAVMPYQGAAGAHSNMQPYLVLSYCICVNGLMPVHL